MIVKTTMPRAWTSSANTVRASATVLEVGFETIPASASDEGESGIGPSPIHPCVVIMFADVVPFGHTEVNPPGRLPPFSGAAQGVLSRTSLQNGLTRP